MMRIGLFLLTNLAVMLIFGLVMVLMMMWRPQGLLPATRPHVELPR